MLVLGQVLVGCTQPLAPLPARRVEPAASASIGAPPRPPLVGEAVTMLDTEQAVDVADFAWSPSGEELAVEEPGQAVGLWHVKTGTRRASLPVPGSVLSLRFATDGATLLVVTMRGAVAFRTATGECLRFVPAASRREAMRAAFGGPDLGMLATADVDGVVRAVDIATGAPRWEVRAGDGATFEPTVTAADRLVTRSGSQLLVRRFDTGQVIAEVRPPEPGWQAHLAPDGRSALFVAPDRRAYALADPDGGRVRLRETIRGTVVYLPSMVAPGERQSASDGAPAEVLAVVFSPDASTVVVTHDPPRSTRTNLGRPAAAVFIDVARGTSRRSSRMLGDTGSFAGGARRFYAPTEVGSDELFAFDVASGKARPFLPLSLDLAVVSPTEREIAVFSPGTPGSPTERNAGSSRAEVRVVDMQSGAVRLAVPVTPNWYDPKRVRPITAVAIGGRADQLVFGGALEGPGACEGWAEGLLRAAERAIVPAQRLEALQWLPGESRVVSIEREPQGRRLGLVVRDSALDTRWSRLVDTSELVVSADGRWLVLLSEGVARLTSVATGAVRASYRDPRITSAAFDPQGKLLALGSWDERVTIVGLDGGATSTTIAEPSDRLWFLPDGTLVAADHGRLAFYDPRSGVQSGEIAVPSADIIAVSRDGMVVLGENGSVVETRTGTLRSRVDTHGLPRTGGLLLSPDGERVAVANEAAATVELRDTRTGGLVRRALLPPGATLGSFSADHGELALLTLTGVELVREADGATLDAGIVAPAQGRCGGSAAFGQVMWLSSGHFEADAAADPHVRVWTATGLRAGDERKLFARAGLAADVRWETPTARPPMGR
jgi:WD40 repeat protein